MTVKVLEAGPLATVQDLGRKGYAIQGFRECGACDKYAMQLANILAGNPRNAAVLECTLAGGKYQFEKETVIALTGAITRPKVDGQEVPMFASVYIKSGQVLEIPVALQGLRVYLAVHGGIDVPLVMGSRSTDVRCRMGGYEGRALQKGDLLPVGEGRLTFVKAVKDGKGCPGIGEAELWMRKADYSFRSVGKDLVPVLRAVPGPQDEFFSEKGKDTFVRAVYKVGSDSDRMASRLEGSVLENVRGLDILSDGIVEGSVQISSGGQPMVMLADHQTTGGYAKIATVISTDIPAIAQKRPGEKIAFAFVTAEEAICAARRQERRLAWFEEKWRL